MAEKKDDQEWLYKINESFELYESRINDLFSITPRTLLYPLQISLQTPEGIFKKIIEWNLFFNSSADLSDGRGFIPIIRLNPKYSGRISRFDTCLCAEFRIGNSFRKNIAKFRITNDLIENLTKETGFRNEVVLEIFPELNRSIPDLFFVAIESLKKRILKEYGEAASFLFDRANYHQSIRRAVETESKKELKNDKQILEEIESGLRQSKGFAKSKLLASLREKCEKRIYELNFSFPDELQKVLNKK